MARILGVLAVFIFSSFLVAGGLSAEDAPEKRMDCMEACDTKMMQCLDPCPRDENGDFQRACRNVCAVQTFHPCLDKCPHPRTGLTPAQAREMKELQKEQAAEPKP